MGPTAAGKTTLAIELCKQLPVEIISIDASMIYKDMNIGTSTPNADELKLAPHRLINICDVTDTYSVSHCFHDVKKEISNIIKNNKIPLLVGGTLMYFTSILNGLYKLPPSNKQVRLFIQNKSKQIGWDNMYNIFKKIDKVSSKYIHKNDVYRISRILEIFLITGKSLSELKTNSNKEKLPYFSYKFIISPIDRFSLHNRIKNRFNKILQSGFDLEVQKLFLRKDVNINLQSMKSVGYRQMWSYLSNEINYEKMKLLVISATNQIAKRQITWLKKFNNTYWLDSQNLNFAIEFIKKKIIIN